MQLCVSARRICPAYWLGLFGILNFPLYADIATDGTVGPAQALNGPAFSIPESLGSRVGGNLFHSFIHFSIANGEQATFTGSSSISNVISRVTGGQISNIDGLLRSTVGQADFYFLNPAGVVFGANAQIDVPGSFYVSTADELRFPDGSSYSATNPSAGTLSIDQPQAFGFLGDQTASITLSESNLVLNPGNTLSLSAGELVIDKTRLTVDRGEVQFVSVGNFEGTVTMDGEVSDWANGSLSISQSRIDVSGDGAGRLVVRSGSSSINSSDLFADSIGPTHPLLDKGIDIEAESLHISDSLVTADTFSSGQQGADVNIIVADKLSIVEGGLVSSTTFTQGNAGDVMVKAGELVIDELGSGRFTGIVDDVESNAQGNAGGVTVNIEDKLSILGGGIIRSNTFSNGNAGSVSVTAGELLIDGNETFFGSGISSDSFSFRSAGNAGTLTVRVKDSLSITNNGFISSFTGLGGGDAGNVEVSAGGTLSLVNHARIFTDSFASGDAGNVTVEAGQINIDNQHNRFVTGISSASRTVSGVTSNSSGQAGNITVKTQDLLIKNSGVISIRLFPTVDAATLANITPTEINITAQNITLSDSFITTESLGNVFAGSIILTVADTLSLDPSFVSTVANNADGGAISIRAKVIDLQDSQITTSVSGQGDGGDINLDTDVLVLDSGFIQANTSGINAQGGNIRINTNVLVAERNNLLTGGDTPLSFQPGINVIQAAAPDGVSGNIDITTPQLDISGELIDLDSALVNVDDLAQNPCATTGTKQSTLVSLGRGGLPESPERAGSISITPERLQLLMPLRNNETDPHSGSIHFAPNQYVKLSVESNTWLAWLESNCE